MKHNDSWEEQLRRQLSDAEAPVPAGLWEDIERSLPTAPHREKIIPVWVRWTVAAMVAIVVGYGVILSLQPESSEPMVETLENRVGIQTENDIVEESEEPESLVADQVEAGSRKDIPKQQVAKVDNVSQSTDDVPQSAADVLAYNNNDVRVKEPESETKNVVANTDSIIIENQRERKPVYERAEVPMAVGDKASSKLTFSLMAQNGLTGESSQTERVMMAPSLLKYADPMVSSARSREGYYLADADVTRKYSAPVALGLGVSYALNSRWQLHTGLDYLRTTTSFIQRVGTLRLDTRNQLTYLGIPLKVSRRLYHSGMLNVYAAAGPELYLNVKNRRTTNGVISDDDLDKPIFSADVSLGIELRLLRQAGIYVEPGLRYYFDNGSRVDSYFKEHPLSPDLHLGLRYNF